MTGPSLPASGNQKSDAAGLGFAPIGAPAGSVRALHVVAGLYPSHGGPSYSVPRLCHALSGMGLETVLVSVAATGEAESDSNERGFRDRRFRWDQAGTPILRHLRLSSGLSHALLQHSTAVDVIHNHGLWLMPNVEAARAARRAGKPFVLSPRGMLAPAALAFSRMKKRAFWNLLQADAARGAACIHVTSEEEYVEIREFGLAQPVAVIGNGIDIPEPSGEAQWEAGGRTLLSLGRLHQKKGLDVLLHAWARVEAHYPDWRLVIAGPAEAGHDRELQELAAALGLARVSIDGPMYGDAKHAAYRNAELFVLPTMNENFGLTVAEALAAGTPAISTTGAPWRGLETEGCGWWIAQGIEPLARALTQAMALPPVQLRAMGARGRAWVAREFSWDRVAAEMIQLYRWLNGEIGAPGTVRLA